MGVKMQFDESSLSYGIDIALCVNRSRRMADTIRDLADGLGDLSSMLAAKFDEHNLSPSLRHLRVRVVGFGSSASGDEIIESPFYDFSSDGATHAADHLRSIPLTEERESVDVFAALNTAMSSPWVEGGGYLRRFILLLSDTAPDCADESVAARAGEFLSLLETAPGRRHRRNILFAPENELFERTLAAQTSVYYAHTPTHGGCRDIDLDSLVSIMVNSL